MKKHSAFSLIELSLVILVIGLLIAGITQGRGIVMQAKLSAAQTQTAQSPVNSIPNLAAWYETTSEKSFDSAEAVDNSAVSVWHDINSQSLVALNAIQSTNGNKPIYKANIEGGLPMLQFNGSSSYLEVAYDRNLNSSQITIFAVIRTSAANSHGAIVSSRNDPPITGYIMYVTPNSPPDYELWSGSGSGWVGSSASSLVAIGNTTILTATNSGSETSFYNKGSLGGKASSSLAQNTVRPLRIGAGKNEDSTPQYFYNGYIGELIIFGRYLKTEERKSVEKYLSRKWGVALS